MSVIHQKQSYKTSQIIAQTHLYLSNELQKYRTYFSQTQNQIKNTLSVYLSQFHIERTAFQGLISQLEGEVARLKEANSFLRNEYMINAINQQELKKSRERVVQEHAQKEERVRQLAEQVESLKLSIQEMTFSEQMKPLVCDDEENRQIDAFEGLEIIREVSQNDLSVSLSQPSLTNIESLEDKSNPQTTSQFSSNLSLGNYKAESEQSIGNENCQIENYQDALQFLKSYSNERGMKATKKPIVPLSGSSQKCKKELTLRDSSRQEPRENETISKIKKMIKIEDTVLIQNPFQKIREERSHEDSEPLISSKSLKPAQTYETLGKELSSSSSIAKESIVNLQTPIKTVNSILDHIRAINSHVVKRQEIKDDFYKVTYEDGFIFVGRCSEGRPSGFGKLLRNNEIVFQGEWRDGRFHGWGKLILLSFARVGQRVIIEVEGHFKSGMMQGGVVCTFSTGERFMGTSLSENLQKQGSFISDKGIMTGYWQNNRLIYLI